MNLLKYWYQSQHWSQHWGDRLTINSPRHMGTTFTLVWCHFLFVFLPNFKKIFYWWQQNSVTSFEPEFSPCINLQWKLEEKLIQGNGVRWCKSWGINVNFLLNMWKHIKEKYNYWKHFLSSLAHSFLVIFHPRSPCQTFHSCTPTTSISQGVLKKLPT
jgi:hypothetical protein